MAHTIVEAVVAMVVGAVVAGAVVVGAVIAAAGVVVVAVVPGLMGQRRCQRPGLERSLGAENGGNADEATVFRQYMLRDPHHNMSFFEYAGSVVAAPPKLRTPPPTRRATTAVPSLNMQADSGT